jgi:sulfonate transport system substrate-binding protein
VSQIAKSFSGSGAARPLTARMMIAKTTMHPWKALLRAAAVIFLIALARAHAEPLKIRVAYVVPVTNIASILFAKDGIAKHNGKTYTFDAVRYQASTTQIIALANGELDMALLGFTSLPLAIDNAHMDDLRAIIGELQDGAAGYYSNEFAVLGGGPIHLVEDLKGKIVATNAQGSAVDIGMRARLHKSGLEVKRDYTIIEAQFSAVRAILTEHKADLVPNVPSFSRHPDMVNAARPLFTQADGIGVSELGLWVARADYIQKNRAVLVDFLEDYLRMVRFYTDPANHDEAVAIAAGYMKLPTSTFQDWLFTKKDYYRDPAGRIDVVSLQRTYGVQQELGFLKTKIDAGRNVDLSPIEEAGKRLR